MFLDMKIKIEGHKGKKERDRQRQIINRLSSY